MKIAIVGTGYQGLVVGTCLAENGHQVRCVDRDKARVDGLRNGTLPIFEPGLEELVARNMEEERLDFGADLPEAVSECLAVLLCVNPNTLREGASENDELFQAVDEIAAAMTGYRIVVNKSTSPPGTADAIVERLRAGTKHSFDVVVNPDFLKEGAAIDDFMRPDRVVIGCADVRVREIMRELYSPFLRTGKPLLFMDQRSAEMTKYATNAMLATRISLMNQLADLCAACGADVAQVREGVGADDRIGPRFLFPGLGFGGQGLPKDLATCVQVARDLGVEHDLLQAVLDVNQRRLESFIGAVLGYYGDAIANKRIAVWGASFKARTDDLRGAPALRIIDRLRDAGASVTVYDPVATAKLREAYGDAIDIAPKYYKALDGADGLVITTEWNEFRRPDYERMGGLMREKVIFDGRNLYTPAIMREHGFTYFSIGRAPVQQSGA